jgi:hypothetical protein
MAKKRKDPKTLKNMLLALSEKEDNDLIREADKFSELINVKVTPQKFLIKLLYDHIKRNKK